MISFDATAGADLNTARRKEWLETNGLGGYAPSTITGMNTRRFVRYQLQAGASLQATLELRPLIAFRDYHSLTHEYTDHKINLETSPGLISISLR